ncbi:L-asparaginase 1 [Anabrus simplex]|uniref:L-asparaginase 1 n=1 Tax=Anabrus simplex TaxID=316456 RepID=UPI0035A39654
MSQKVPVVASSTLKVFGSEMGNIQLRTHDQESRVLVIYTGGTIGMTKNGHNALAPVANQLINCLRCNPVLHDEAYGKRRFGDSGEDTPLVLPEVHEKNRVVYTVEEYEELLDSSNMTVEDWSRIANDIRENYKKYDGFVVLHGTDTLAYTASALSFMLENLGKTVILTGSQIPIFETRGDGRDNLLGALILAGNYIIPEVTIFFGNKLFRGNRTTKVSTASFNAFDSLNIPPLATIGICIDVDYKSIFRQCDIAKFTVHSKLDRNVGLLRLFPSITTDTVRAFLQPPTRGVVLQTYGAGNIPSNRQDLMEEIQKATSRGVIVVNITQCILGSVCDIYETGQALLDAGVTPGSDMTPEAALTKLSYVLSKSDWDLDMKRKMMRSNLRGELTTSSQVTQVKEWDLVDAVAHTLDLHSNKEQQHLRTILYPAIVTAAVQEGSIDKLRQLKEYGANLSACNADARTPLHIACCEGNLETVRYLLSNGASVHAKDRYKRTPLMDAINFDHHDVIELLIECGAHITGEPHEIGGKLCSAAAAGSLTRLRSFQLAKADFNLTDRCRRTPLHMAVIHGHLDCVSFLLEAGARKDVEDVLGYTATDLAFKMKHLHIQRLLNNMKSKVNGHVEMNGINGNPEKVQSLLITP